MKVKAKTAKSSADRMAEFIVEPELTPAQRIRFDADLAKQKRERTIAKEEKAALLEQLDAANKTLSVTLGLKDKIDNLPPVGPIGAKCPKPNDATACLLFGDWHTEEKVDPLTVNGVNEYNLAIASRRATRVVTRAMEEVGYLRKRSNVKELVLALLGDFITGYIHDELVETNYLSPTQATLKVYQMLRQAILSLLEHGGFDRIVIVCNFGNHGRTTIKSRIKTAAQNSYEWMLYQFLAASFEGEKRIVWQVADGYHAYLNVYEFTYRFHHGNGIKYQGGIGGLTIPMYKAISQWNKAKHADVDCFGHWHTRINSREFCGNGSLIGYTDFSVAIKAPFELPSQSMFLIEPRWNKTVEVPIYAEG